MEDTTPGDKLWRSAMMALVSANPEVRNQVICRTGPILRESIMKEHGEILGIAPMHLIIPIRPKPGKEEETLKLLKDSMKWVSKEEGILSASVYQLAASPETDKDQPKYMVILMANNQDSLRRLKKNPKSMEMQKNIMELSGGLSATDDSVISINTMLTGMQG
jgi:quinol monooxygenase YgiN